MGGLRHHYPKIFGLYLVMAAALVGIPLFSGALSKNALLLGMVTWDFRPGSGSGWQWIVPLLALSTSALTGYYVARKTFLIFMGENRLQADFPELVRTDVKLRKIKVLLWIPLAVLAFFSLGLVFNVNPLGTQETSWWLANFPYVNSLHPLPETLKMKVIHPLEWGVPLMATLLSLGGIALAFLHFRSGKWLKASPKKSGPKAAIHPYEKALIPALLFTARKLDLLDRKMSAWGISGETNEKASFVANGIATFDQQILEKGIRNVFQWIQQRVTTVLSKLPQKWRWGILLAGILILVLSPILLFILMR